MGVRWDAAAEAQWGRLAAEVFLGMKEWRLQHPQATFQEIEQALDARLSALRARMLQDVALASAAAAVRELPPAERPRCPACGGALVGRGRETRAVTVTHGQTVTLARDYAVCSACEAGLFPPR
jgi:YgiT-type zinc finger domain-containing protein